VTSRPAVLDTSVLVAHETGRPLDVAALPAETAVSVVTHAALHAGVLAAVDTETRARRLVTLEGVSGVEPLPGLHALAQMAALTTEMETERLRQWDLELLAHR